MDLTPYVSALRHDLAAAAAAGDEQTQRTAAVLGAALEPAARLAIMNALSDFAAEVTAALGNRVVDIRLDGREVRVGVGAPEADTDGPPPPHPPHPPHPPMPPGMDAGDISRITLRLVEEIKSQAERAASAQGVSLNSWLSQAVQGALQARRWDSGPSEGQRSNRVRGWVQG